MLTTLLLALAAPLALARDAYVGNEGSGTVSVIDLASGGAVGEPIEVGSGSGAIAITPDGRKAYVANHLADGVSVIDTETNETLGGEITVGEGPRGVAISPDGSRAYVANEESGTVSVIATASDEVVGTIDSVAGARSIAVSPDGRRLYVGQNESNTVSVIDAETGDAVGEPIEVGSDPQGIAFTPDGSKAYVASLFSGSVSVIDTASDEVVGEPIEVGSLPVGVAVTPDGKLAYVANTGSDSISVIDTETNSVVGEPIDVATGPRGVAISPDGGRAYVATGFFTGLAPGTFSTIDTASDEPVGEPLTVGNKPLGVAIVPNQPPLAALGSVSGIAGEPVQLNASASHDPDGQIARYDWSFGDGQTAPDAGPTPTHVYGTPGAYRMTVTLTDSEGCSTSFVFTGLTASCNGSSLARATRTVEVAARPARHPSNDFRLGELHRDRRRGIAKLEAWIPDPGVLQLRGTSVRAVNRTAAGAGTFTLAVRPKREERKALIPHGHLKVGVEVTFLPDGGVPRTLSRRLGLVRGEG